jgi:hypothetical protein
VVVAEQLADLWIRKPFVIQHRPNLTFAIAVTHCTTTPQHLHPRHVSTLQDWKQQHLQTATDTAARQQLLIALDLCIEGGFFGFGVLARRDVIALWDGAIFPVGW